MSAMWNTRVEGSGVFQDWRLAVSGTKGLREAGIGMDREGSAFGVEI